MFPNGWHWHWCLFSGEMVGSLAFPFPKIAGANGPGAGMQSNDFSLPTKRYILQNMGPLPYFLRQQAERSHCHQKAATPPLKEPGPIMLTRSPGQRIKQSMMGKKKTKNLSIDYLWKMFYELHFVNKEILFRKGSTLFCSKYMFTSLDQVTSKKLRGKPFLGMNSSGDKYKPCTQDSDEKVVCWGPGEEGALRM